MEKNRFVLWLVCDQDRNICPTLQELEENVKEYYDNESGAYEFEISLVKEDNKLGQQSCGWDGKDKIILFDSLDYEFDTVKELYKNLVSFYARAEKKCKYMNKNKEDDLY